MRNLKKVLSLSLALVMLLGMMVVGAGAAKFDDVDDGSSRREAIEVMSAIKAINGDGTGNFYPKDILNRAEAAVIIANTVYTRANVEKMNAASCSFTDMAGYEWANGAVEACATAGIIVGDGQGHFSPADEVTGTQFAVMLLRALELNLDANGNDKYSGKANWEFLVLQDAIKTKLDNNKVPVTSQPLSREDAAQMAFNAMNYGKEVTTTTTKYIVESTSTSYTIPAGKYAAVTDSSNPDNWTAQSTKGTVLFSEVNGTVNGEMYNSFAEAKTAGSAVVFAYANQAKADNTGATHIVKKADYGTHFTVTAMTVTQTVTEDSWALDIYGLTAATVPGTDAFGNPSKVWSQNGVNLVSLPAGSVYSTTDGLTYGQLYTALGLTKSVAAAKVTYIVDGKAEAASDIASGSVNPIAGKGAEVNVFKSNDKYTITVKNTYVGKITSWTKAQTNSDGQVTAKEYVALNQIGGAPTFGTGANNVINKFETDAFTKDDVNETFVLYTIAMDTRDYDAVTCPTGGRYVIKSVEAVEPVTLTPTRLNTVGGISSFVADGTTYNYSAKGSSALTSSSIGTPVEVIFDEYGYVIYNGSVSSTNQYAVLLDWAFSGSGWVGGSDTVCTAKMLLSDGTTVEKTLYTMNGGSGARTPENAGSATDASTQIAMGSGVKGTFQNKLISWTEDSRGVAAALVSATDGSNFDGTLTAITKNVPQLKAGFVANNNTVFLIGSSDGKSVARYEGIANVPSVTQANGATVQMVKDAAGSVVLAYIAQSTVTGGSSAKDLIYVLGSGVKYTEVLAGDTVATNYWVVPAVVNGVVDTVKVADNTGRPAVSGLLKSVTRNSHDIITTGTVADGFTNGNGMITGTNTAIVPANGVVSITGGGTYSYSDNTQVFVAGATGFEEVTMANLSAPATAGKVYDVVAYAQDNVLAYVFVTQRSVASALAPTPTDDGSGNKTVAVGEQNVGKAFTVTDAASGKTVTINDPNNSAIGGAKSDWGDATTVCVVYNATTNDTTYTFRLWKNDVELPGESANFNVGTVGGTASGNSTGYHMFYTSGAKTAGNYTWKITITGGAEVASGSFTVS